MSSEKNTSKLLGLVFLWVAIASILSGLLFSFTIGSGSIAENLVNISNNVAQLRISIVIDLITSVGIIVLGILLFVVLQKQNRNIALIALGFYLAEAIILAVSKISYFLLIPLSLEYIKAGSLDSYNLLTLGLILKDASTVGWSVHMLFFSLGAILFYYLFYKAKSIPQVLALWGLIAALLALIHTFLALLNPAGDRMILLIPEMFFELTIGFWLIIKGFRDDS